jgi:putative tricarboxylic transport membrane protein
VSYRALPITATCFLLLGIAYLAGSLKLPMGSAVKPGAGLFPLLVGVSLTILSLLLLIFALKQKEASPKDQEPFPQGKDRQRVAAVAITLILFVVLLKPLGYGVSSALLMAATLRLLGLRSWGKIVLISILTAAISYYLFDSLLGTPLPRGLFFS